MSSYWIGLRGPAENTTSIVWESGRPLIEDLVENWWDQFGQASNQSEEDCVCVGCGASNVTDFTGANETISVVNTDCEDAHPVICQKREPGMCWIILYSAAGENESERQRKIST